MSDVSHPVYRNKKGQFTTKKKKHWQDNANDARKRKRLNNTEKSFTLHGRRIVELDALAEELWCKTCDVPLSLRDTIAEKRHCLSSRLEVRCRICQKKYNVSTCKSQVSVSGAAHYPVNDKIVIAMYNTSMGPCKLNNILSAVKIPTFKPTLIKKYEENLSHGIAECADANFTKAIQGEKAATNAATSGDKIHCT